MGEMKTVCWLLPVGKSDETSGFVVVRELAQKLGVFGLSARAQGRKSLKQGDLVAFYVAGEGICAHGRVTEAPARKNRDHPLLRGYPYVFSLGDVEMYSESPVRLDVDLRKSLDAFDGKDPETRWAWFVQGLHRLTGADFRRITRVM